MVIFISQNQLRLKWIIHTNKNNPIPLLANDLQACMCFNSGQKDRE